MQTADFVALPAAERADYFNEVAARRDMPSFIVEKDFWVCYLLQTLFETRFGQHLVFKGGTSLSKVYGAIRRFSEDVDLTLDCRYLNQPPPDKRTGNAVKQWRRRVEPACCAAVEGEIAAEMRQLLAAALSDTDPSLLRYRYDETNSCPVLEFGYPTALMASRSAYITQIVRLEFGSRNETEPAALRTVQPWLQEEYPDLLADWSGCVRALAIERTFWEKATILHVFCHQDGGSLPAHAARHYADLAALAGHECAPRALGDGALRRRVVDWKQTFFARRDARYDMAQPPTFRLLPGAQRLAAVRRDYVAMRPMFFTEPKPFDAVIATLEQLETRINTGV